MLRLCWLQVKTRQGTELLIQSENDTLIMDWYHALQDTISTHVRTPPTSPSHSDSSLGNVKFCCCAGQREKQSLCHSFILSVMMCYYKCAVEMKIVRYSLVSLVINTLSLLFFLPWESKGAAEINFYNHSYLISVCVFQAWESDEAIEEDMPESPGGEKHDKEKEHRDSKKVRGLCAA